MKKCLLLLLCFSLLLGLFGCSSQDPQPKSGFKFYYPRVTPTFGTESGVITYELRDTGFSAEDYVTHLTLYFLGPQSEALKNPFPSGLSVISVNVGAKAVFVVLSDLFAELSGLELTTACACLTMTLSGLTGLETVQIRAQTQPLNGNNAITMRVSDLLFLDQHFTQPSPEKGDPL